MYTFMFTLQRWWTRRNQKMTEVFKKEEKKLLMELICNEQIHMIIKNHTRYDSDKYKKLEELIIKIKDL